MKTLNATLAPKKLGKPWLSSEQLRVMSETERQYQVPQVPGTPYSTRASAGDIIFSSARGPWFGWPRAISHGPSVLAGRPLPQLVRVLNSVDSDAIDQPAVRSTAGRVNSTTTGYAGKSQVVHVFGAGVLEILGAMGIV